MLYESLYKLVTKLWILEFWTMTIPTCCEFVCVYMCMYTYVCVGLRIMERKHGVTKTSSPKLWQYSKLHVSRYKEFTLWNLNILFFNFLASA